MARSKVDWRRYPDSVEVEIHITPHEGDERRVEVWQGMSRRHAVWRAREHYRGTARADLADEEPV